jgi:hypothetical protein
MAAGTFGMNRFDSERMVPCRLRGALPLDAHRPAPKVSRFYPADQSSFLEMKTDPFAGAPLCSHSEQDSGVSHQATVKTSDAR